MPHTTNTPNPQNGPNNPYGYSPNTYNFNGAGSIGAGTVYASGAGFTAAAPLEKGDYITFSTQQIARVMDLSWVNGNLCYTFIGEENGTRVKMVLAPESDMKPIESFALNTLIHACSNGLTTHPVVMQYVRQHNLERHFKFSAA